MEGRQFDQVARSLAGNVNRRQTGGFVTAILAALAARTPLETFASGPGQEGRHNVGTQLF
jgi:hypothetical protein